MVEVVATYHDRVRSDVFGIVPQQAGGLLDFGGGIGGTRSLPQTGFVLRANAHFRHARSGSRFLCACSGRTANERFGARFVVWAYRCERPLNGLETRDLYKRTANAYR